MQRRGGLIAFVLLNILISLGVAFAAINFFGAQNQPQSPVQFVTSQVIVTATPDPNATIAVRIITATPLPGLQPTLPPVVSLPTDLLAATGGAQAAAITLDATTIGVISASDSLAATATSLPANCIIHVIKEGDTPFGIAVTYNADPFQMLAANGLDEAAATALQIGQSLIVPLPGCPLGADEAAVLQGIVTAGPSATPTLSITLSPTGAATGTAAPTIRPTVTLAPTAANAAMRIVEVLNAGDVTAESIAIRNTGAIVDIGGWTLSDADGTTYTFGQQRLFTNAQITLFTRVGTNTPVALFWGRDQAVFQSGDTATLRDASGNVQSTFRVP
jgi:hypothetical protein